MVAKNDKSYEGSLPLVTFGAMTAAIIAVFTIVSGAIILIPTFLWSVGLVGEIDAPAYRLIWWAFRTLVTADQRRRARVGLVRHRRDPVRRPAAVGKVSRTAFLMYILFLQLASAHHLLVDPGVSSNFKMFNTSYAMYLAVMASMVHGPRCPVQSRRPSEPEGAPGGLFTWLRKAPWGNPTFRYVYLWWVLVSRRHHRGGWGGANQPVDSQHPLCAGPLSRHGCLGTTLAFMALTYWLVPVLFRREIIFKVWRAGSPTCSASA